MRNKMGYDLSIYDCSCIAVFLTCYDINLFLCGVCVCARVRLCVCVCAVQSHADLHGSSGGASGEHASARGPAGGLAALHQLGQPRRGGPDPLPAQHHGRAAGEPSLTHQPWSGQGPPVETGGGSPSYGSIYVAKFKLKCNLQFAIQ